MVIDREPTPDTHTAPQGGYLEMWHWDTLSREQSTHIIGVLLTNRLLTLIIGSWESILATVITYLLSLRVRPGYGAW